MAIAKDNLFPIIDAKEEFKKIYQITLKKIEILNNRYISIHKDEPCSGLDSLMNELNKFASILKNETTLSQFMHSKVLIKEIERVLDECEIDSNESPEVEKAVLTKFMDKLTGELEIKNNSNLITSVTYELYKENTLVEKIVKNSDVQSVTFVSKDFGIYYFVARYTWKGGSDELQSNVYLNKSQIFELQRLENSIEYMTAGGLTRGNHQGKHDLGIILPINGGIKVRQINPNFKETIRIELFNDDSHTEKNVSIPSNGTWIEVVNDVVAAADTGKNLPIRQSVSVPLVTQYVGELQENPVIEVELLTGFKALKKFVHNITNQDEFLNSWIRDRDEFVIIDSERIQLLVPLASQSYMLGSDFTGINGNIAFKTINAMLDNYREYIFFADEEFAGLETVVENPANKNAMNKYFVKANIHGSGAAYYGGNHMGVNANNINGFLMKSGWGRLHEIGHAYQWPNIGGVGSIDMNNGEVWNNIPSHVFQRTYQPNGWLYGNDRLKVETNHTKKRKNEGFVKCGDLATKLYFHAILEETFTLSPYKKFMKMWREQPNSVYLKNSRTADLLVAEFSKELSCNLAPYFDSWSIPLSDISREEVNLLNRDSVSILNDVVSTTTKLEEIKNNHSLRSTYSLVKDSVLDQKNITGQLELTISSDIFEKIKNKDIILKRCGLEIEKIRVTTNKMNIPNLSVGNYTLTTPNIEGESYDIYIKNIVIKENQKTVHEIKYDRIVAGFELVQDQEIRLQGRRGTFMKVYIDRATNEYVLERLIECPVTTDSTSSWATTVYGSVRIYDSTGRLKVERINYGFGNIFDKHTRAPFSMGDRIEIYHYEPQNRMNIYSGLLNVEEELYKVINNNVKNFVFNVTSKGLTNKTLSESIIHYQVDKKLKVYADNIRKQIGENINNPDAYKFLRNRLYVNLLNIGIDLAPYYDIIKYC
ncbi:MAG: M60 family metallopeptidase [Cetobacterium sp.]|uniref:M60 family metallopeptidase n=1 Tax=Cetobacterium sp. TaxID=2071632 RepID=UPI003EE7D0BA